MRKLFLKKSVERKLEIPLKGFDERLNRRVEVISLIEKLTAEKEQIEEELKSYMGEAEIAQNEKFYVSWKPIITNRIDTNLLKKKSLIFIKSTKKKSVAGD